MKTYCLDTSLLINGWNKHYRIDVFPEVWQKIGSLLERGDARIPWEVFKEVDRREDELQSWVSAYKEKIVRPTDDELEKMRSLMSRFPNIAAQGGSTNAADPWVIVLAQSIDGIVVTDEQRQVSAKPTKPPKITFICEQIAVPWMTPIDFLASIRQSR